MRWLPMPHRRYAQFPGRARRREFALFMLFVVVGSALGYAALAERSPRTLPLEDSEGWLLLMIVLAFLFGATILVASFAPGVRRLHDIDRKGWWMLVPAAALVRGPLGARSVVDLIVSGLRGRSARPAGVPARQAGTNRYGSDPRGVEEKTA